MSRWRSRMGQEFDTPMERMLCDGWTLDGQRLDHTAITATGKEAVGQWPGALETDALVRLSEYVGEEEGWPRLMEIPAVAQKLDERAKLQPLDICILRHLTHLIQVCHKPRLKLRIQEERLPVSRAKRFPVRAVADLISHPGDWEHRTLRSIQPARVLSRVVEDDWDLYENRVAGRLVDHLLSYLSRRLEELQRIQETFESQRDYGDQTRTSFWRARRISKLWAQSLVQETEGELGETLQALQGAQRRCQALLFSPLYKTITRGHGIPISLKPTNILVNDLHYRRVAALWRMWARHGHRKGETQSQRLQRRQQEGVAWDRFVVHLVLRSAGALGCRIAEQGELVLHRGPGWRPVHIHLGGDDTLTLQVGSKRLRFLPLCAQLAGEMREGILNPLKSLRERGLSSVLVHVGPRADTLSDDIASGWSFGREPVLFPCSPWDIDSEERMARLLNGWLAQNARPDFPYREALRGLPQIPDSWEWLHQQRDHVVVLRVPTEGELGQVLGWINEGIHLELAKAQRAKRARRSFEGRPLKAINQLKALLPLAQGQLEGLKLCPVCGKLGQMEAWMGTSCKGDDSTWKSVCLSCKSTWGRRVCGVCQAAYHTLEVVKTEGVERGALSVEGVPWFDRAIGRDQWAQPCHLLEGWGEFRCPECGNCSGGRCQGCAPSI